MNVRTVCLSILYTGESTGYDIRKLTVEGEYSYFIDASFGAIYPALQKLEDDGLVMSRVEPQAGRPSRKVYAITEAGRRAFLDSLFDDLGNDEFRSPFLLFARFAHILPRELVEARANEFLQRTMDGHRKLEEAFGERGTNASDTWVINYGRAIMEVAERHMRSHMHELITMARADAKKDAAE